MEADLIVEVVTADTPLRQGDTEYWLACLGGLRECGVGCGGSVGRGVLGELGGPNE